MKEFYELANELAFEKDQSTIKKEWTENSFTLINFSMVKSEYMKLISDPETAEKFHMYNDITDRAESPDMAAIYDRFERIVFKESRGGGGRSVIGWENINSYLQYHSGIHYKWFRNN